jgi:hypothetical protein
VTRRTRRGCCPGVTTSHGPFGWCGDGAS